MMAAGKDQAQNEEGQAQNQRGQDHPVTGIFTISEHYDKIFQA
jgi:hypothetical protein